MRKPAILITGANGEMGHGLIETLHQKNQRNIVAMDLNQLEDPISDLCFEEVTGNILDIDLIDQLNGEYEFDTIYHLAALLSTRAEFSPRSAHDVNVGGTMNLLNLAIEQGRSQGKQIKFFFPSSIAVYGYKNLDEKKAAGIVKENSYKNPHTMYGCNKLYCEYLGNYYSNNYQCLGAEEHQSYIDFRSIRFPGIISSKTTPTAGTSDYIPEMVESMKAGSAIMDLAAPNGGNCEVTEQNEVITHSGVKIDGMTNLPATMPNHASSLYAKNLFNLFSYMYKDDKAELDMEDEIVNGSMLFNKGSVNNDTLQNFIDKG